MQGVVVFWGDVRGFFVHFILGRARADPGGSESRNGRQNAGVLLFRGAGKGR